jgi:hypothetical protein
MQVVRVIDHVALTLSGCGATTEVSRDGPATLCVAAMAASKNTF